MHQPPITTIRYEITSPSSSYYTDARANALRYALCLQKQGIDPKRIKIVEITDMRMDVAVPLVKAKDSKPKSKAAPKRGRKTP
jgi:hypothetical protein